jgi:isoquinoline 1-oxidoreductase
MSIATGRQATVSLEIGGQEITFETGKLAKQADGAVVVRDGDFLGVVAPTEKQSHDALNAIKAQWQDSSDEKVSSAELFDHLKKTSGSGEGRGGYQSGSLDDGFQAAAVQLEQVYTIAYIAHAPLEPRAAVAQWENDKLTVWTGTQRPFGVRGDLANAFRIAEENVRVIVPDTGSGYGGKHSVEAAIEAARLARSAGKPVKVVWTREEEFTWAYFRPAGLIEIRSGASKDGMLTAWEFHNYNSGASAIRTPYEVPHQQIEFHSSEAPLRQGSYRALASTANVFARETHMDELAAGLKLDPLVFRLKNLKDQRMRAVLEAAAASFDWGKTPAERHGCGIACGFEKGSYVATCAEVFVDPDNGRVQVVRAVSAFECGAVVNPDHLKNQVEGALVQGLGGALFEAMEFEGGRISNASFSGYRVPRFRDAPAIEVVLVDRKDLPSEGAGETPIIGIAPAVGNAVFAACGVRLRSMPLAPKGVKG